MPLRVKLTDRFQKQFTEWARKRKPFKNKQELKKSLTRRLNLGNRPRPENGQRSYYQTKENWNIFCKISRRNWHVCRSVGISFQPFQV